MPPTTKVRNRKPVRMTTAPAVGSITETTATVTWRTSVPGTTVLDYGLTTAYGSTVASDVLVTDHSVALTALTADTTYYYRVTSVDQFGSTVRASGTFDTLAAPPAPAPDPIVISAGPSVAGITETTATVSWTTNIAGTSEVDYGQFDTYGLTRDVAESVTAHSVILTGLTAGKTYHYRVRSDGATNTVQSADATFATTAATTPTPPAPTPGGGTPNVAAGLTAAQLQSAIQALINASTPVVLAGTTYTLSTTVVLSGLVKLDLNGSDLHATGDFQALRIVNPSNGWYIYGTGGTISGFDSSGIYRPGDEDAHGITVQGGTGGTIGRDTANDLYIKNHRGDGIYLQQYGTTNGNGIAIGDGVVIGPVGRMGIAPVAYINGTIGAVHFVTGMYRPLDFEPDINASYQQQVTDWTADGCVINCRIGGTDGSGTSWLYIGTPYTGSGNHPLLEDITVTNCTVTSLSPTTPHNAMHIDVRDYTANRITVTDNTSTNNWNTGMTATHVATLVVTGNDMNSAVTPYPVTSSCTSVTANTNT